MDAEKHWWVKWQVDKVCLCTVCLTCRVPIVIPTKLKMEGLRIKLKSLNKWLNKICILIPCPKLRNQKSLLSLLVIKIKICMDAWATVSPKSMKSKQERNRYTLHKYLCLWNHKFKRGMFLLLKTISHSK